VQRNPMFLWSLAIAVLAVLIGVSGLSNSAAARERSSAIGEFENGGVEPGASGKLNLRFSEARSRLQIKLKNLIPNANYTLRVGGIDEDSILADKRGRASLKYETPRRSSRSGLLDFDPRDTTISIHDGAEDVLALTPSNSSLSPAVLSSDETFLPATSLAGAGTARVRSRVRKDGRQKFSVELKHVAPGTYDLFVDGVIRGSIVVASSGRGQIEFDTQPQRNSTLLDFDPRGASIDIVQGTSSVFAGPLQSRSNGINQCNAVENEVFLTSNAPPGQAKARIRTRDDCDRDLRIEVEKVASGSYDVVIDGVLRGTIQVAFDATSGENEGEIEFDSDPDDPQELLLDFEPTSASIEIVQGAMIVFAGMLDASNPTGPTACSAAELLIPLAPTGAAPGASGEARFRDRDDCDRDFKVEAEDVPVGDYDLFVGGVLRGTIPVRLDSHSGKIQGEIEFETGDSRKPLLDFDPRGQLVEVSQNAVAFLTAMFSSGSGNGGGQSACTESSNELPLLNAGVTGSARGEARVRLQDDCDEDLRVEIEKVSVGDYDLLVDGVVRATLVVAFNPTSGENEGEVEFDTSPDDPNEILLDFATTGAVVEVEKNGSLILFRQLP